MRKTKEAMAEKGKLDSSLISAFISAATRFLSSSSVKFYVLSNFDNK